MGPSWPVEGDDDLGLDDVGVHAHLRVVVEGHQGPVGDSTTHVTATHIVLTHNKVLHCGGVEELDIGGLQVGNHKSGTYMRQASRPAAISDAGTVHSCYR